MCVAINLPHLHNTQVVLPHPPKESLGTQRISAITQGGEGEGEGIRCCLAGHVCHSSTWFRYSNMAKSLLIFPIALWATWRMRNVCCAACVCVHSLLLQLVLAWLWPYSYNVNLISATKCKLVCVCGKCVWHVATGEDKYLTISLKLYNNKLQMKEQQRRQAKKTF